MEFSKSDDHHFVCRNEHIYFDQQLPATLILVAGPVLAGVVSVCKENIQLGKAARRVIFYQILNS